MSSIHYKFKATLEYKTLLFDGLHISVTDLKKEICEKENIKTESFDLVLTNAHTKRQYSGDELIPRNSSVIVQRIPRDNAAKLPKVQDTTNSGIVTKPTATESPVVGHIDSEEFDKMTEEERLAHIKEVSTYKYSPSNFQKKTSAIMSGPPPPTYVCNRCSQSGHWYKNCPMLNTRRTTGITMDELMETTSDDPLAMLHPSGKYVVPIMHWKARQKKPEVAKPEPEIREIPPELKCPICSQLLRDAVLTTCCGDSFCADCLQQRLLETPNAKCPGTNCFQTAVSADKLVPNLKMRQAVEAFKHGTVHGTAFEHSNNSPRVDEQPVQSVSRVRIGLSGRPQQVQSAMVIHQPQQQQQQQQQQQPQQHQYDAAATPPPQSQIPTSSPTYVVQPNTNIVIPAAVQSQIAIKQFSENTVIPTPGIVPGQNQPNIVASVTVPNMQQLTVAPPSLTLPVNVHQPPPGYPAILPQAHSIHVTTSSSTESIASGTHTARSLSAAHLTAPQLLLPPGVQPPPPGLSAAIFPRVPAPPPIKDAWDEYLERKDKESRQRATAPSSRRRRRSSRSTSYSSSSTSSESSSKSSRSRSRSSSRDRSRSHRGKRRNDGREKHSRRRDSRSPFRSSYASTRYHRDNVASFNLYQHSSGATAIGLPGASLIHHRIPSLLNNYSSSQYTLNQTNQAANYNSFSNGSVPSYRSSRTYLEERSRRHSPRSVQNRRRNESRERESDRKERTEERRRGRDSDDRTRREDRERRAKGDSDKEERRQKRDKYKRRQEKESKEVENAAEGRQDGTFKVGEEKDVGTVDLKEIVVDDATKQETTPQIEDKETENSTVVVETTVEKENATVDEALPDGTAVECGVPGFRINHDDGSGAEAENENEGLDDEKIGNVVSDVVAKDKERSEKKKHRKKKRKHRKHEENGPEDEETGRKKHRKHKRSKEEKEQRKQEKEKRREERRRRRHEREAGQVNAVESLENKESECKISGVVPGLLDNDHENEMIIGSKVTVDEVNKDAVLKSIKSTNSGILEQKSEERAMKESKLRANQGIYGDGRNDGKEGRNSDSSSLSRNDERKNTKERLKHDKDKRHKHDLSRKRDESKDDSRFTRKRNDDKETKRNEDKDSRKEGDKSRKNDRKDEKVESRRWENKEGKTKGAERESKRHQSPEKIEPEFKKELKHKEHGDKRKADIGRSDHKRPRLKSHDGHEQRNDPSKTDQKFLPEASEMKKSAEVSEIGPVVRNETDPLLLSEKKPGMSVRTTSKAVDSVDGTEVHETVDQKQLDEIKVSIEKELERKVEAVPTTSNYNMPNLTVELKSGGEKRVTRENIFEGAMPHFNARQKIKMILLSESERKAADRSSKKKSGTK